MVTSEHKESLCGWRAKIVGVEVRQVVGIERLCYVIDRDRDLNSNLSVKGSHWIGFKPSIYVIF